MAYQQPNRQWKPSKKGRGVEWCDDTWQYVRGCYHECEWEMPDGEIAKCYAKLIALNLAAKTYHSGFEHHYQIREGVLGRMKLKTTPRIVFGDSMSDLFGHWVSNEEIETVIEDVSGASQHLFIFLTKNAPRLRQFDYPSNMIVGVSTPPDYMWGKKLKKDQKERMLTTQMNVLQDVNATRVISIEPLSWDLAHLLDPSCIDWALIGAASHGKKLFQPNPDHTQAVVDIFKNTPMFLKGNLEWPVWYEDFPALSHPALDKRRENGLKYGWTPSRY